MTTTRTIRLIAGPEHGAVLDVSGNLSTLTVLARVGDPVRLDYEHDAVQTETVTYDVHPELPFAVYEGIPPIPDRAVDNVRAAYNLPRDEAVDLLISLYDDTANRHRSPQPETEEEP